MNRADSMSLAEQRITFSGFCLPIMPYLDDLDVDPETKRVLGVALEMTRVSLGLADDFANRIIAMRIVELAKAGERNPPSVV